MPLTGSSVRQSVSPGFYFFIFFIFVSKTPFKPARNSVKRVMYLGYNVQMCIWPENPDSIIFFANVGNECLNFVVKNFLLFFLFAILKVLMWWFLGDKLVLETNYLFIRCIPCLLLFVALSCNVGAWDSYVPVSLLLKNFGVVNTHVNIYSCREFWCDDIWELSPF